MKAVRIFAWTLTAVSTLAWAGSAQELPPRAIRAPDLTVPTNNVPFAYVTGPNAVYFSSNKANALAKEYTKAEKESEKREIREKLTELLKQQFDEHMKHQQKELEDLEKQISDLRTLMSKRANAKAAIVDRRIEQLIQDAEGLGWNSPNVPGVSTYNFDGNDYAGLRRLAEIKADEANKAEKARKKKEESNRNKDRE